MKYALNYSDIEKYCVIAKSLGYTHLHRQITAIVNVDITLNNHTGSTVTMNKGRIYNFS